MVRGVVWVLGATSFVAVALSLLLAGRSLGVDPDLGPAQTVVLPAPATPAARVEPGDAPADLQGPGARTDPKRAVPVEPHDEDSDRSGDEADNLTDRADDAADKAADAEDDAEDREDSTE